ncbi:MAG: hypothetical protein E7481_06295 [Ruminococcaceae bacterium]|nr:hypothetical protein [Oscillospiraceae bacterium]
MEILRFADTEIAISANNGSVISLIKGTTELLATESPLFSFCIRTTNALAEEFTSNSGKLCNAENSKNKVSLSYNGFDDAAADITVTIELEVVSESLQTSISVHNTGSNMVEWVGVLPLILQKLRGEGGKLNSEILYPYNEGALVDSIEMRQNSWFPSMNPEYPSHGSYPIFPNMVFAQMMAYLYEDKDGKQALYFGAHDVARGVKVIDFVSAANGEGVEIRFRYYCGVDYGEDYNAGFPFILRSVSGCWEATAEIYRSWFENNLPKRLTKISENKNLPDWYEDNPFVVSYPVRGIHDMDIPMNPNKMYPYTNALPIVDEIAKATNSRLLILLMHWEGTAPWAPPYVWPAFGDHENFDKYFEELHSRGHLLGVYCSGFGYTINSNLIDYNCEETYNKNELESGMCAAPNGEVQISRICTGQRSGYDICPASETGREILADAYLPLLKSKIDYAQILDQNHGGGQYFCYSKNHGHAPAPGPWMTSNMQNVLGKWNDAAGKTLLGCESAAAEPFIGNLMFSDNRYELCYHIGRPIPLYAYIYHEYVRNFMGNQVCCPLPSDTDTLRYRMGYSFSIGDCMTVVLTPDGDLMSSWGTRDFEHAPDKEKAMAFVANMTRFYREKAKQYLYNGRMIAGLPVECEMASYGHNLPEILSSAWEANGKRVQILINAFDKEITCKVGAKEFTVPANDAILLSINDFSMPEMI